MGTVEEVSKDAVKSATSRMRRLREDCSKAIKVQEELESTLAYILEEEPSSVNPIEGVASCTTPTFLDDICFLEYAIRKLTKGLEGIIERLVL